MGITTRCYWCGRFGAKPTTYRLHHNTPEFTRPLCPGCAAEARIADGVVAAVLLQAHNAAAPGDLG